MEPGNRPDSFVIARIVRARGNRGEVLAELHTDFPDRFEGLREVLVEFADGRRRTFTLDGSWEYRGMRVLKFAGVDTIDAAQALAGAWVELEADRRLPLPEGSYYDDDLVGCSVRDAAGGFLGVVADVLHYSGNDLLEVRGPDGDFLVPAVAAIVLEVSIVRKEILVSLPEGLVDLNR